MEFIRNPYRGRGLDLWSDADVPFPSVAADRAIALLRRCPKAAQTPLHSADKMAEALGVAQVFLKDERDRMGLGSFKALGAAFVIARDAESGKARGTTYITASAGNHGLSVAAGAAAFGARAVIFLSAQVPESFAERLRNMNAVVIRSGDTYEDSMAAAARMAEDENAVLLSDSSWPGYTHRPHVLMEGYLVLMEEVFGQIPDPPTHIFLQAGVGGLAGAAASFARARWGDEPVIVVVEPEAAPALMASIAAGHPVTATGPVSAMGRLDCKDSSLIALKGLARDADSFAKITEGEGFAGAELCTRHGYPTSPSGAAGVAALIAASAGQQDLGLDERTTVLAILTEGAEP